MDRHFSIPEIRGLQPVPRDRVKRFSAQSYAAQYGITIEDAEELIATSETHQEVEHRIHVMFSRDDLLKKRSLNWHEVEEKKAEKRRAEIEREREEAREKRIAEAKAREAAKREAAKREEHIEH